MKIAMDVLCRVFSKALDVIEEEQIGASEHHGMRVSALCAAIGKRLGYDDDAVSALATCALFHDNALTEFNISEREDMMQKQNMVLHCRKGQENVAWLPFKKDISGFILYHHEFGNGKGPFRKKTDEYPFEAAILAAVDSIDVAYHLQNVNPKDLAALRDKINENADEFSTRKAVDLLLDILDADMLDSLRDENIVRTLDNCMPDWEIDVTEPSIAGISGFISRVIDFKSRYTQKHTSQIANRAWIMGEYYGYNHEENSALYLAASLHDIGKITTPLAILEKPGKLEKDEFDIMKNHVRITHDWLSTVPDFEQIKNWAANHHEKLNGTGYSFGKNAYEMDFNSRLMACIDIYQAVSELRPYHEERSHTDTMPILYDMADKGFIDKKIVKNIDEVMEKYSMKEVPCPYGHNDKNQKQV
uniref:Metal dependent phosphohydrolase n=1 Tax=uncultured bacterium contig00091 TaxID=1181562 RepID=A0A806K0F1_9BACT|nr:metal dependent phosphohydrolase [uncultured bacterium contig00091]